MSNWLCVYHMMTEAVNNTPKMWVSRKWLTKKSENRLAAETIRNIFPFVEQWTMELNSAMNSTKKYQMKCMKHFQPGRSTLLTGEISVQNVPFAHALCFVSSLRFRFRLHSRETRQTMAMTMERIRRFFLPFFRFIFINANKVFCVYEKYTNCIWIVCVCDVCVASVRTRNCVSRKARAQPTLSTIHVYATARASKT